MLASLGTRGGTSSPGGIQPCSIQGLPGLGGVQSSQDTLWASLGVGDSSRGQCHCCHPAQVGGRNTPGAGAGDAEGLCGSKGRSTVGPGFGYCVSARLSSGMVTFPQICPRRAGTRCPMCCQSLGAHPRRSLCLSPPPGEGYKDEIVHETLLEVLHDGVLGDLGQQHHVIHAALLDIVALPVEALLAALRGQGGHSCCARATSGHQGWL